MAKEERIALVTGANRGLGLETVRELAQLGYLVILTSRNETDGKKACERLKEVGTVLFHTLDVASTDSIQPLYQWVEKEFGRLDVLVNNAGITDRGTSAEREVLITVFNTNVAGAYELCRLFLPLMKEHGYGRVVNVSSRMGQLSSMDSQAPAYRISKAALNAVTALFASECGGTNVLINSVHPGWVRTDMGGPKAERDIHKGVDTIVWAATLPEDGPNGQFLFDRAPIAW